MALNPDLVAELRKHFRGDIRQDLASRILYSTDASIYQIEPAGILIPRIPEDLQVALQLAAKHRVPVTARGAGTSLAGQAIGNGIILDCSRWLDRILEIDPVRRTATVEPGVILADLNRAAAEYELQFGPDPASAERATMGGVVANNAAGAHSVQHGMTVDHLLAARVVVSDGTLAEFGPTRVEDSLRAAEGAPSRADQITVAASQIREQYACTIREHFPKTWRNSAGYRLNYLLPWSGAAPRGWKGADYPEKAADADFNLAHLLAGSEGTLGVLQDITVRLVGKPRHTVLAVLAYPDLAAACEAVVPLLDHGPAAIELIPRLILQAARRIPEFAGQLGWLQGDPAALLILEFAGDEPAQLVRKARALDADVQVAEVPEQQAMVWATRKAGLGLLDSSSGPARPISFIEDCAVPVEHLATFVRELERILDAHGARGGIYGHASAGCLHARPVLDLKTSQGTHALRAIADETLGLTLRLGGAMSSEHGDGMTRGEWLRRTYGAELTQAMLELKRAADPDGILNPGKMLDAPPMDTHLRYGGFYRTGAWVPQANLSARGGLAGAIEQCNGQGVCRKVDGVMCPSFQATREEIYSTRGRANLLRAMISTGVPPTGARRHSRALDAAVFQALDLCLGCKGCLAECPSGVDMAQLKSEFLQHHYRRRLRPIRDYLFGHFGRTAELLAVLGPVVAHAKRLPGAWKLLSRLSGITSERDLPEFRRPAARPQTVEESPAVLLLSDPYSRFVDTAVEDAALHLLGAAGYSVRFLDKARSCAALVSKGFLRAAARESQGIVDELRRLDPTGSLPLVVLEPSELAAVRSDAPALIRGLSAIDTRRLEQACSVEEFLVKSGRLSALRVGGRSAQVLFQPHCHEKPAMQAPGSVGSYAGIRLLEQLGYDVQFLDAGCCGMGGTFGFEVEHYALSQAIGALKLFPAIEASADALVAAPGGACRIHITQATQRKAEHPLVLAARALGLN